jgi:hypothetical protein
VLKVVRDHCNTQQARLLSTGARHASVARCARCHSLWSRLTLSAAPRMGSPTSGTGKHERDPPGTAKCCVGGPVSRRDSSRPHERVLARSMLCCCCSGPCCCGKVRSGGNSTCLGVAPAQSGRLGCRLNCNSRSITDLVLPSTLFHVLGALLCALNSPHRITQRPHTRSQRASS